MNNDKKTVKNIMIAQTIIAFVTLIFMVRVEFNKASLEKDYQITDNNITNDQINELIETINGLERSNKKTLTIISGDTEKKIMKNKEIQGLEKSIFKAKDELLKQVALNEDTKKSVSQLQDLVKNLNQQKIDLIKNNGYVSSFKNQHENTLDKITSLEKEIESLTQLENQLLNSGFKCNMSPIIFGPTTRKGVSPTRFKKVNEFSFSFNISNCIPEDGSSRIHLFIEHLESGNIYRGSSNYLATDEDGVTKQSSFSRIAEVGTSLWTEKIDLKESGTYKFYLMANFSYETLYEIDVYLSE